MYAEAEYRLPLLRCAQTLGGVIFVNATTASNRDRDIRLFNYVRPAVGFGFRILVNKHTRLNIDIDFGCGFGSKGVYFAKIKNIIRQIDEHVYAKLFDGD